VGTYALHWVEPPAGPAVDLLDQTRLPARETYVRCADVPALVEAIRALVVRGAPLLGVAGAYGVALAAAREDDVAAAAEQLIHARPTAVNLGWGVRRALAAYQAAMRAAAVGDGDARRTAADAALTQAHQTAEQDAAASAAIAVHGLPLIPRDARILTHCNTGALVSAGEGTAFAVILAAHRSGRLKRLWIDETRPLLQGSRLTAYEAARAGIPHSVLPDSAAASLLAAGEVDVVITGADRIAADGSVANKVGTYGLAVLAAHHGIPLLVAAPMSTVDPDTPTGVDITVEHRAGHEVTSFAGKQVSPTGTQAYNPAFDVTPGALVTALVTERGVAQPVTAGTLHALRVACDPPQGAHPNVSVER
jgi:methylthioribose-1-phosphate isomerase